MASTQVRRTADATRPRVRSPRALLLAGRQDSLVRNSGYLLATTVVTSALGYLFWVLAARLYTVQAVGVAAAMVSAGAMVMVLSSFGVPFSLMQVLPRTRDVQDWSRTVSTAIVYATTAGALTATAAVLVVLPLTDELDQVSGSVLLAGLFVAYVGLGTAASVVDYVAVAERASHRMFWRNTAASTLKTGLLCLPVVVALDSGGVVAAWALSNGVTVAAGCLLLSRLRSTFRWRLDGSWQEARRLLRLAWHQVISVATMAPMLALPVVAGVRLSAVDAAYGYIALRVAGLLFMISPAVTSALYAEGSHRPGELRCHVERSAKAIGLLLVPSLLVLLLAGRWVLHLFGAPYAENGARLLLLLAVAAVPDAVIGLYVAVLRVQQRLRRAAALTTGTCVLSVVGMWVLLPSAGIAGAGLAWLGAQSAGAAVALVGLRRERSLSLEQEARDGV